MEISESFISDVTHKVLDLQKEWQSRELKRDYAFAYLDAIHVSTRIDGKVGKRALHLVLAYDLEGRKEVLGHTIFQMRGKVLNSGSRCLRIYRAGGQRHTDYVCGWTKRVHRSHRSGILRYLGSKMRNPCHQELFKLRLHKRQKSIYGRPQTSLQSLNP